MENRPKTTETENDLLKLQEQFLKSSSSPSAKLVRVEKRNQKDDENVGQKRLKTCDHKEEIPKNNDQPMELDDVVLSDIVERDVKNQTFTAPASKRNKLPFPKIIMLNQKENPRKGESLFAQHFAKTNQPKCQDTTTVSVMSEPINSMQFGQQSRIIDGSGLNRSSRALEARQIHEQNVKLLSGMSEQEILKEREKQLAALDPAIIQFLKKKKTLACSSSQLSTEKEATVSNKETDSSTTLMDTQSFPIEPLEARKWLHMDHVESDKLAWMVESPSLETKHVESGYNARFDFEGELLSSVDVPTHAGLHHHGDEPSLAGYTFEELIQYSRSSVGQQRVLAFRTLGNIIKKTKLGLFDTCMDCLILPKLLEAGIPILLRLALDDGSEGTRDAALYALHALVISEPDEICLDVTFTWPRGFLSYFLHSSEEAMLTSEKDFEEMSDEDVFKLDCVKGLLRTDILHRLSYILLTIRPTAPTVNLIFEILIRIARHSLKSSQAISKMTKMLKFITTNFIPLHWNNLGELKSVDNVYGVPVPLAVKLVRVLSSSSRNLAITFAHDFRIMDSLLEYIASDPTDLKLPPKHAFHLILESMRTWKILLSYNVGARHYVDLFPVIMKQLHSCQQISMEARYHKNAYDYDYAATLLSILETVVDIAASHSHYAFGTGSNSSEKIAPPVIQWSHVDALLLPVVNCFQRWLHELTDEVNLNHSTLKLMGSACSFLANYYSKYSAQASFPVVDVLDQIEKLFRTSVTSFLRSNSWTTVLQSHRMHSNLLSDEKLETSRDSATLPSVGSIAWGGAVVPLLNLNGSLHFLEPFKDLILTFASIHRHICKEISAIIVANPLILNYVESIVACKGSLIKNWFTRYETHYVYHLVKLATIQGSSEKVGSFQQTAFVLLPWIQLGDEHLLHDLLSTLIFNPSFWDDEKSIIDRMLSLSLKAGSGNVISKTGDGHTQLMSLLPRLRSVYLQWFEDLHSSSKRDNVYPTEREHVTLVNSLTTLLPVDWPYMPIKQIWLNISSHAFSERLDLEMIVSCLQWICILESCRAEVLETIPTADKFCYLGCIFLIANDLFLDASISVYLGQLCVHLAMLEQTSPFDTRKRLPAESSFRDFYLQLLTQFGAVSYGDHVFGLVIVLPLQQRYDIQFRKDVWIDNPTVLQYLSFPVDKFPICTKSFLSPPESDADLITAYCSALTSGFVSEERSPLPFLIAVHHLHHFLFVQDSIHLKLKSIMLHQLNDKHSTIADKIRLFKI